MKRPLVGLTTWKRDVPGDEYEPLQVTLVFEYVQAVVDAGGAPLLLSDYPSDDLTQLATVLDGLIMTGGGDVCPSLYGSLPTSDTDEVDTDRDHGETQLLAAAMAADLPVLGICRGIQLINVALGGTLHQRVPTSADHPDRRPKSIDTHEIRIAADSRLSSLYGKHFVVNSLHHQGLDALAPELEPIAWAPDGLVEGVVHRTADLLAVQWHPEKMNDGQGWDLLRHWVDSLR